MPIVKDQPAAAAAAAVAVAAAAAAAAATAAHSNRSATMFAFSFTDAAGDTPCNTALSFDARKWHCPHNPGGKSDSRMRLTALRMSDEHQKSVGP